MAQLRSLAVAAIALASFSLSIACGPKETHRRARSDSRAESKDAGDDMRKGVAEDDDAWFAVEGFGTRVRVPKGWEYGQQGALVLGTDERSRAAFILVGANGAADARKKLDTALELLKMDLGASSLDKRTVTIHGRSYERQDYAKAIVDGKPAHGVALVGDAPKGRGKLVLFVGYALEGQAKLDKQLADAIDSIDAE
jgi:hypothetical protein